ncbi:MAG TPA: IPT/TIG domain-containing protein [Bryobacteraceae bacterium]|nr:IPT/TIG domain-containing protein [Bryobacteraceae bacterium]
MIALAGAAAAFAQVNVLNVNYDTQQTAANLQETSLSPGMNWSTFGKVGTLPVDGQVYAQPLYVSGVSIGGTKYNVLYVVTMADSVFAFNADAPQSTTPLWQVNLGIPVPSGLFNFTDILPQIGILGTPAIDPNGQVLYVVADIMPSAAATNPVFQLHALSLVDGHEMFGGPVQVAASVPGSGAGSTNGTLAFDASQQLQRPGLILSNGTLYVSFGSHADTGNYHGWIIAYNASTLQETAVYNSSPSGRESAFWHSGRAPAIDANGDVFAATGNGDYDGVNDFGESVLHLSGANLSLLDWYTPQEWSDLNNLDEDVGSAGVILIPNTNLLLSGGKSGFLYLIQDDAMGHLGPDTTSTVQGVQVNSWGMFQMALWNNPQIASTTPPPKSPIIAKARTAASSGTSAILYEFDPDTSLKAFEILDNQINATILSEFTPAIETPYAGLAISANGGTNGIVWLTTGNYSVTGVPATLHALDATDLSKELWNSDLNANRDQPGDLAKFCAPTIANGRVYLSTFSNSVVVYGSLNSAVTGTATISAVVNSASYLNGGVSPGELITIFGANLGPTSAAAGALNGNTLADTDAGVQVTFGGIAAPLLYVSASQINAVVPFGVNGASTQVQVLYQGQAMASTTVPVQPASPALFSLDATGGGQGAILNQNLSVNSSTNGASPGSVIVLYATGGGLTMPASVDGLLTAQPYPLPLLPVSVSIDGIAAQVLYAGAAPGLVAGVMQINVVVPLSAPAEPYDQVVLTVGDYSSPTAVTVAVQ